jgi:hypothetical protein
MRNMQNTPIPQWLNLCFFCFSNLSHEENPTADHEETPRQPRLSASTSDISIQNIALAVL